MTQTLTKKLILFDKKESVAIITLNRDETLNSFNRQMALELQETLEICKTDKSIRSIILTGTGRAFCAGQDLEEASKPNLDLGAIVREYYNPIIRSIRQIEKPVIAAVNGVAAGAGANIALACDFVIASREASFIQAFSKIGLIPDSGGTFFLPRLVGLPRATAMMMLAEKIQADKAFEIGMIYSSVEPPELMTEAETLAIKLAMMPTKGLGLTKRALNMSFCNNLEAHLNVEEELQKLAGETYDYREGIEAFLQKRQPDFKGE